MKHNELTIQPYIHLLFKDTPNKELSLPYSVHIYDISEKTCTIPDSIDIIPAAGCVWIISYNTPCDSRFICVGSHTQKISIDISGYSNCFIAVFSDNAIYFNKGASASLRPSDIAGRIIDFKPDSSCPEYDFLCELNESDDFTSKCRSFKEYIHSSKRCHSLNDEVSNMRTSLVRTHGNCTVSTLSEMTGYSCRHIYRLFNDDYGFGPKELCRYLRFQHALNLIFTQPDISISEAVTQTDYSDQAHFQREFKYFMDETPKHFITRINSDAG